MVGERGITGRILKPYFLAALHGILKPSHAERLIRHINALYLARMEGAAPAICAAAETIFGGAKP